MLKPIEPKSTATVVWHKDPAVEEGEHGDYPQKAQKDPSCWQSELTIKKGQKPTKFIIGVIPSSDLVRAESDNLSGESFRLQSLFWECFLMGVRDIQNWSGDVPKVKRDGAEFVDPEWLERNFARDLRACGLFVGGVAWKWNCVPDSDPKN